MKKATIDNATIVAENNTAVEIKSGNISINKSTITSDVFELSDGTFNHNGTGSGKATININNAYAGEITTPAIGDLGADVSITASDITNTAGPAVQISCETPSGTNSADKISFKADDPELVIAVAETNITTSVGASDTGYSFENGNLILNNYNGSQTFDGVKTVTLIGQNTISIDDDTPQYVIKGAQLSKISTVQGSSAESSLTISFTGENALGAIYSGIGLEINNVTLDIQVENTKDDGTVNLKIVDVEGNMDVRYSNIDIVGDVYENKSHAIESNEVDAVSSNIVISEVSCGICATNVKVAGTGLDIDAEGVAIDADVEASNESVIDAIATGTDANVFAIKGSLLVSQYSSVTASGMYLDGTSSNNATVINNGNMIIDGLFVNEASFTNNGIIGVYGEFENKGGETVNNGEINTYGYGKKTSFTEIEGWFNRTVNGVKETIALKMIDVIPLADGSFAVKAGVTTVSGSTVGTYDNTYTGTMTISDNRCTIKTTNADNEVATVSFELGMGAENYSITVTELGFTVNQKDNSTTNLGFLGQLYDAVIAVDNNQYINVSGGILTNNGSISIATAQDAEGYELVQGGTLTNNGEMFVSADIKTINGTLTGNAISIVEGIEVELTGIIDISFAYAGEYTYENDGEDIIVAYDNELKISGNANEVKFSTTVEPDTEDGYAAFMIAQTKASSKKAVTVTLVKGVALATKDSVIGQGSTLEILSGSTFEAVGTVTVGEGVLAVQDGAKLNVKGDAVETYTYGKLVYVMSFTKDGYTYYGSLTYALANASEGMTLVLNTTETIDDDLIVGKGITLQFAKNAALIIGTTEKDITITMSEDAKFEFTDKTNSITANGNVKLSGTFVYDGNELVLDSIAFVSGNGIVCNAATKTDVSNITLTIDDIDAGTVKAQVGTVKLSATFSENTTNKTASALVIAEGATVIETAVTMNAGASVTIDGTYKPAANESIASAIVGTGSIVLEEGNSVEFTGTKAFSTSVSNGTDSLGMEAIIINDKDAATATNYVVTITSVAKAGTKAAYLDITGVLFSGTVTVVGNAGLSDLDVGKKAIVVIPAESIATVLEESTATGLVKVAGTINMKVEGDSATVTFAKLVYEITYADGEYTVYTVVGTAVENAKAGDVFTLTDDLDVDGKLEVPSGVTIVIPEGKKISLGADEYLLIGTPMTTLGATGGIQGTVELSDNAFVIEYADITMDNSTMEIVGPTTESKIVDSQVSVLNQLYATVYALKDAVYFSDVADMVEPEIEGYRFVEFTDSIGNEIVTKDVSVTPAIGTQIGSTDIVANMKANMVQVTFTAVEGLTYYVNNLAQNTVGAPVYVEYGSTITAAPVVGYTGTALVNGQSYIVVDSETSVITGSGVTEKVTEIVTEGPEEGMDLTDILLIVLVVLIVIMAIIVALRMMRS